jgi:hypothetical protein
MPAALLRARTGAAAVPAQAAAAPVPGQPMAAQQAAVGPKRRQGWQLPARHSLQSAFAPCQAPPP